MTDPKKFLYLHLYQAENLINNSKKYTFSDKKKVEYLETLIKLFYLVKDRIDNNYDPVKIFDIKNHIDFIFKSLEFLKDSTLNTIPFEVVGCLDKAMNDWIDPDKFIIVTGLQNNLYSFSYDLQYANNELFYQSLIADYNITFNRKLVQINLPLVLSKDYLSSVALYHELGHFVDTQYSLTLICARAINSSPKGSTLRNDLIRYFPYINDLSVEFSKLYYHLGEYFCDLFAAQYIGKTLSYYLEYITSQQDIYSSTHPSTTNRTKVVLDFVDKVDNPIVNLLIHTVKMVLGKHFEQRYNTIISDDFYKLVPYDIKSDQELHGIIVHGWEIWMSGFDNFNKLIGYKTHLSEATIYKAINSLIEKSIGNYFIINSWQNCKNE